MQLAIISFVWSAPRADLVQIPGTLGAYCYGIHYADGRKRIGGTSRTADTDKAIRNATSAARHVGFTHYAFAGQHGPISPL